MASLRERLDALANVAGFALTPEQSEQLQQYYLLLERWNRRINLTALPLRGYPSGTLNRLFLEPFIASHLVPDRPITWFDLGSGGGSPAIPLKVLRPATRLTMVESRERKAAFLREVSRTLHLADSKLRVSRFEAVAVDESGSVDLITVRAVQTNDLLWNACREMLRQKGRILLFVTSMAEVLFPAGFHVVNRASVPGADTAVLEVSRVFHVER